MAMTKNWFTNSKNNYKNEKEKTKKKHKEKINVILTVCFTQNNQWIENDSNDNEKERWVYN